MPKQAADRKLNVSVSARGDLRLLLWNGNYKKAQATRRPLAPPAEDLSANARATGEVLTAEQPSNNDKGDVENTIQVLAELKKQQREAPVKAPQMDAPVLHTVLAEIPATSPADAQSTKKFGLHRLTRGGCPQ